MNCKLNIARIETLPRSQVQILTPLPYVSKEAIGSQSRWLFCFSAPKIPLLTKVLTL